MPDELLAACDPLIEVAGETPQDILITVIENYRRAAECRIKHEALVRAVQ